MKVKSESEVAQLCLTLSDPMDCSPEGASVYGIFQARVLEWDAIAFSHPTCQGAKKKKKKSSCITTNEAHALQQEKPPQVLTPQLENSPHSLQLEKAHARQGRPSAAMLL